MKKSLIALAVAGAMTAPMVAQADATLYGSFRMAMDFADGADANLRDEATRVGIKGTVDLGLENTKGLFTFEQGLDTAGGVWGPGRLAYMGATGDWGTATAGRQYHPYYLMVNSHTNIFQTADADFGEAFALGNTNHKRVGQTLAYASPVMSGFQVVGGIVTASTGDDDDGHLDKEIDGYNVGAEFTGVEGLRVSASYGQVKGFAKTLVDFSTTPATPIATDYKSDIWGLGATYKIADLTLAAKYEEREDTYSVPGASEDIDWAVWELAAVYQMGSTALKARYGEIEAKGFGEKVSGDQWGVEVEQKLGNRGYVWAGYNRFDDNGADLAAGQANVNAADGVYKDRFNIGYRLDF